jgi:predicted GNAT family acetyltransferase
MAWQFSGDVGVYDEHVGPLLRRDPVRQTLALTLIEGRRGASRPPGDESLFGWHATAGGVHGAVSLLPGHDLLLSAVPAGATAELVAALRARDAMVPGVTGPAELVDRFLVSWCGDGPAPAVDDRRRLYVLAELAPPRSPPAGVARRVERGDAWLVDRWLRGYQREVDGGGAFSASVVRARIEAGLLLLWRDPGGRPVALAGRSQVVAEVARIGPVYTPPEHRGRGYGSAVTAASAAEVLGLGASHVVLFAQLSNPTSNAVYQRLGFHPVGDHRMVRFEAEPS